MDLRLRENRFAAMAFLPLFMPNVLQAMRWGPINDHAILTWSRLLNTLCQNHAGPSYGVISDNNFSQRNTHPNFS